MIYDVIYSLLILIEKLAFFNKQLKGFIIPFKKSLWHRCFPVSFAKFLRTPFFIEHLRWLLLQLIWKGKDHQFQFKKLPFEIITRQLKKYWGLTSSHRRCSVRKGVLWNFAKFTGITCVRVSFLINLQDPGLQIY